MAKIKKKVIVGMSSGVDSTVAASLLKRQGYDVVGVFLHFWKEPNGDDTRENKCCSLEAQEETRKLCRLMGIPLIVVNAEKDFKKYIVDNFISEYKEGRTPNPCVICNEKVKFEMLMKTMKALEGDYVATGHYAEIKKTKNRYRLFTAKDPKKDQSYFLYRLNQKQLAHIIFPLSQLEKKEVRAMAKKWHLPVFQKIESQNLCFISEKSPRDFLKRQIKMKSGKIVDEFGKVLGAHEGLPIYTLGQRKGISLGGPGPYFVIGKDIRKNELIVSRNPKKLKISQKKAILKEVNWIGEGPKIGDKVKIALRYQQELKSGQIVSQSKNQCQIEFTKEQWPVTAGQSGVVYGKNGEVIGGGFIN